MAIGTKNKKNMVPPANVKVTGSGLNVFISVIPEANGANILAQFKDKTLTKVVGKPTFNSMTEVMRQLGRNAMFGKVLFGGKKRGCLGEMTER